MIPGFKDKTFWCSKCDTGIFDKPVVLDIGGTPTIFCRACIDTLRANLEKKLAEAKARKSAMSDPQCKAAAIEALKMRHARLLVDYAAPCSPEQKSNLERILRQCELEMEGLSKL